MSEQEQQEFKLDFYKSVCEQLEEDNATLEGLLDASREINCELKHTISKQKTFIALSTIVDVALLAMLVMIYKY